MPTFKLIQALDLQGECDSRSQYCFADMVEFQTNDALLKKYTVQKAIQSLFDHKPRRIQPGQGSHIVSE
uniref:Uncharacterized protein n=1 Tax=Romanomermis culicivorax TaxID=13658 RepID=A0A915JNY1_ROMCU